MENGPRIRGWILVVPDCAGGVSAKFAKLESILLTLCQGVPNYAPLALDLVE